MSVIDRLEVENGYIAEGDPSDRLSTAGMMRQVDAFIAEELLEAATERQVCDSNEDPHRAAELLGRTTILLRLQHLRADQEAHQ